MALTKEIKIDLIQVVENGDVQVRQVKRVLDDGELVGEQYYRYVLHEGDDITNQSARVKAICNAVWK